MDVDFPAKNIFAFVYNDKRGLGICGKQYFDVFMPEDREVFVDAGAYNGDSVNDFRAWVGEKKYKAYAIEPSANMCEKIKDRRIPNIEVFNGAAWDRDEELFFGSETRGSVVCQSNITNVHGKMIDELVGDEKVTFIKMDIEGAELKALQGAKNTIKNAIPKLAICIYHKATDIYEIGSYILELNPNYKLYIRHYTTCMWETVLYAI